MPWTPCQSVYNIKAWVVSYNKQKKALSLFFFLRDFLHFFLSFFSGKGRNFPDQCQMIEFHSGYKKNWKIKKSSLFIRATKKEKKITRKRTWLFPSSLSQFLFAIFESTHMQMQKETYSLTLRPSLRQRQCVCVCVHVCLSCLYVSTTVLRSSSTFFPLSYDFDPSTRLGRTKRSL